MGMKRVKMTGPKKTGKLKLKGDMHSKGGVGKKKY
jgi:hypothetical protein